MNSLNKYLLPTSIDEAMVLSKEYENKFRFLAGGTDVLVNKFQGNESATCFIDLTKIGELHQVEKTKTFLKIGSLNTLDELEYNSDLKKLFPALIDAIHSVGSPLIRKTGTIGGNLLCENRCSFYNQSEWWREAIGNCLKCDGTICIATGGKKNCFSKFVSDTAIALISFNAQLEILTSEGKQILNLEDIYTGNGITPRTLTNQSLITNILLPLENSYRGVFKKLRQRKSLEFTSLSTAVSFTDNGKIKIVLGGVDPKPIVINGEQKDDQLELINSAIKKARIVENDVYPRKYRKEMISVFLKRSFNELKST